MVLCFKGVRDMPRSQKSASKESSHGTKGKISSRLPGKASRARAYTSVHRPASGLSRLLQPEEESQDTSDMPTARQMEIYEFIRDKIYSRGFGPTVREIGEAFSIRSPNGVVCHLKALEKKLSLIHISEPTRPY